MLGKKKVMPEPGVGADEKKPAQTLTSSKTTAQTNPQRQSYMGCQSSMMKLLKTNGGNEEPQKVKNGKPPVIFGQL